MQLPPVHSVSLSEYFVSGNVIIHETAVIAPGVILEAAPDCQIIVDAGVCLGLGCVITAQVGDIHIKGQAAIAPGSLVIGPVTVGSSACIGARSTIFQQDIDAQALIPPGSLLMDMPANDYNSPPLPTNQEDYAPEPVTPIPSPWDSENLDQFEQTNFVEPAVGEREATAKAVPPEKETELLDPLPPPEVPPGTMAERERLDKDETAIAKEKPPVVGQVYINQLLLTLFPERRYFNP